mmetsp:Transcript_62637/g.123297  ORF Transcript_62637/g.123297 Transcript_62637/m.123297 type:complete len:220 (+) Transcript_62637:347-1006(+)
MTKIIQPAERNPRLLLLPCAVVLDWPLSQAVNAAVGDPPDVLVQHKTGGCDQLREFLRVDPLVSVLVEVQAAQFSRVLREDIFRSVEFEVEPPSEALRAIPLRVGQGQGDLQNPCQVHVALQCLVIVQCDVVERPSGSRDDARKLRFQRHVIVNLNQVADPVDGLLQVVLPHHVDITIPRRLGKVQGLPDNSACDVRGRWGNRYLRSSHRVDRMPYREH